MLGYNNHSGWVQVSNGVQNGRSFFQELRNGKVTITGKLDLKDGTQREIKRIVKIKDGQIWDNKLIATGKPIYHIIYGQFERYGRDIVRFHPNTGKGKHGKARRRDELFGHNGICHSEYKNGRLIKQKFIYDNRKVAYNYNAYKNKCNIYDYNGKLLYEVSGSLTGRRNNALNQGVSVFDEPMEAWFNKAKEFCVLKNGKVFFKGKEEHNQRVGEWVIKGKSYFYENGVQLPKELYNTPPEKLDPLKILKIPNAQLRMAMMHKIGTDRIAECGKVIHKDKEMRLYDIPNYDVKILRVQCTTTKAYYYLRVPKDSKKCEEARQWTFHVGMEFDKPIKFEKET